MKLGTRGVVLVLDRDDGVRTEIARMFQDEYEVATFGTTDAAVAALRNDREFVLAICEFDSRDPAAASLVRLVGDRVKEGRLRGVMTLTGALREEVGECACLVLAKPFTRKALLAALGLRPFTPATTHR